jgi:hypothetical protein
MVSSGGHFSRRKTVKSFARCVCYVIPDKNGSCLTAMSDASLTLAHADINFLAGIIKRRYQTALYLSDMRREPPGASTERRRWKALSMASAI